MVEREKRKGAGPASVPSRKLGSGKPAEKRIWKRSLHHINGADPLKQIPVLFYLIKFTRFNLQNRYGVPGGALHICLLVSTRLSCVFAVGKAGVHGFCGARRHSVGKSNKSFGHTYVFVGKIKCRLPSFFYILYFRLLLVQLFSSLSNYSAVIHQGILYYISRRLRRWLWFSSCFHLSIKGNAADEGLQLRAR